MVLDSRQATCTVGLTPVQSCWTCYDNEVVQKTKETPDESLEITGLDLCYSMLCLYCWSQKMGADHSFIIKLLLGSDCTESGFRCFEINV